MACLHHVLRLLGLLAVALAVDWDEESDLDRYVHSDDGYFSWFTYASYTYNGSDLYVINMTSQKWQDEFFSDRPIWHHQMVVAIPHVIQYPDAAVMAIDGGSNPIGGAPPKDDTVNRLLANMSQELGAVISYISQIPNQPVVFVDDEDQISRKEDAVIAFTWRRFLLTNGSDPTMVLRMPMTKGAKRGLDTVSQLVMQKTGNNITRFGVGGASKRGWTTWSLAATDQRVTGIVPMVMSLLNFPQTLMQHFQNMNEAWSFALTPYYNEDLTYFLLAPIAERLWEIEDPYHYKERLTIPKFVISGTGDEFFLLDDSHHWFNDLPGNMYMMMNPNADHTLAPQYVPIARNVISGAKLWLQNLNLPKMTWTMETFEGGGKILATADTVPTLVTVFEAVSANTTRRDFRSFAGPSRDEMEFQGIIFRAQNATQINEYSYEYISYEVNDFWVASFIEYQFETVLGDFMQLTTEVLIIPDTHPGEQCNNPVACHGELV